MTAQSAIAELARNLACRKRLGMGLVLGGAAELESLARGLNGETAPQDLKKIRAALGDCTRCELSRKRNKLVFGQGPAGAG